MSRSEEVAALRESYLARLDALSTDPEVTKARRSRAEGNAITLGNLRAGGRPSDNLDEAVNILVRMIQEGREDEETYDERAAREYREEDQARRRAHQSALGAFYRGE